MKEHKYGVSHWRQALKNTQNTNTKKARRWGSWTCLDLTRCRIINSCEAPQWRRLQGTTKNKIKTAVRVVGYGRERGSGLMELVRKSSITIYPPRITCCYDCSMNKPLKLDLHHAFCKGVEGQERSHFLLALHCKLRAPLFPFSSNDILVYNTTQQQIICVLLQMTGGPSCRILLVVSLFCNFQ